MTRVGGKQTTLLNDFHYLGDYLLVHGLLEALDQFWIDSSQSLDHLKNALGGLFWITHDGLLTSIAWVANSVPYG